VTLLSNACGRVLPAAKEKASPHQGGFFFSLYFPNTKPPGYSCQLFGGVDGWGRFRISAASL
jgi:hypothetical protein